MHRAVISFSLLIFFALPLRAERHVVQLTNGGQLEATASTDSEIASEGNVELSFEGFGSVILPGQMIAQIEAPAVTEDEYFDQASNFADSIGDQWKLALWCREKRLTFPFERHARRVLELDPNHAEARKALGYQRRDGQWVSPSEIMHQRGYIRFDGRWMTKQQAALLVAEQRQKEQLIDWKLRLHRWRQQLGKSNAPEVQIDFNTLQDPDAIPGLIQLLGQESEKELALLYIETLGRINNPRARSFLMENAVYQNNPIYRDACLRQVLAQRDPHMVEFFANLLKSYDNIIVNRAAFVLAELDYPTAVFPLAAALNTQHLAPHSSRYTYFYTTLKPESRFDIDGPKESYRMLTLEEFMGRSKNSYDTIRVPNQGVHLALRHLCDGQDFGFNPEAWKAWYQQEHAPKSPSIRLARDQ
ncbi:hypothetical protein [Bremerella cremea]|uniref:HEAT repeat domain-containing protein n=1 Tax=Bremerella cremea TaxID=1031537 RepID=UPI0031EFDB6F